MIHVGDASAPAYGGGSGGSGDRRVTLEAKPRKKVAAGKKLELLGEVKAPGDTACMIGEKVKVGG